MKTQIKMKMVISQMEMIRPQHSLKTVEQTTGTVLTAPITVIIPGTAILIQIRNSLFLRQYRSSKKDVGFIKTYVLFSRLFKN